MIALDVRSIDSVRTALANLAEEQMPYAMMTAINSTAFKVKDALQAEMTSVFDRPTPWLVRQVAIAKATKQNLSAVVGTPEGIKDMYGNNTGFSRFTSSGAYEQIIAPHVEGGSRLLRSAEKRLNKIGVLPPGWFAVPAPDAPLDQYGNLSGAWWIQLLSWLNAMTWSSQGAAQNRAEKTSKRKNQLERKGIQVFAVAPWGEGRARNRHLYPGVYLRQDKGGMYAIDAILLFVPKVIYRARFDWRGVAERTAQAELPDAMAAAVQRAIETAR